MLKVEFQSFRSFEPMLKDEIGMRSDGLSRQSNA